MRRHAGYTSIAVGGMIVLALASATPAAAHDSVLSSSPEPGSESAAVSSVSLTFNDTLLDFGGANNAFAIQVIGPDGRYYSEGCVALDGSTVSVPAALGGPGEYEVLWQVVSSDGHPTSDSYTFDYAPDEATVAAAGMEAAPRCGDTVSESSAPTESAPTATDDSESTALVTGLSIGVAAAAVVAAITVFVIGRLRRRS